MPIKTYTTEADFAAWTHTDTEETADGKIQLTAGSASGNAVSPVYEAADWDHWGRVRLEVEQPTGTNAYLRFRSGASSAECLAADWSPYYDEADDAGVIVVNPRIYYLNNPAEPVGAFIQLEVTLEAE